MTVDKHTLTATGFRLTLIKNNDSGKKNSSVYTYSIAIATCFQTLPMCVKPQLFNLPSLRQIYPMFYYTRYV